jgi:hypothetical protein
MAGGTGGHVFPALALARLLRARSFEVVWLGTRRGLEARVIPAERIPIEWLSFGGLRGKGVLTLLAAPFRMAIALAQGLRVMWRHQPMPDTTAWPPKRFTPSRWPSESRPLREEPPAFLCAIVLLLLPRPLLRLGLGFDLGRIGGLRAAGEDFLDAQHGEVLAVALRAAVIVPAPLLEDHHLVGAVLRDHARGDRGARNERGAHRGGVAAGDREHFAENDLIAGVAREALDLDHVVRGDAVLLSAGADDGLDHVSNRLAPFTKI